MMSVKTIDILLYHDPCMDGTAAAWAITRYFYVFETIGISAGASFTRDVQDKTIVFVDTCPPLENINELVNKNNKIIVLDHHKSAEPILYSNLRNGRISFIYDIKRSGCQIAWDFSTTQKRPWVIDYIADRDLWLFKLKNSKLINLALMENGIITFSDLDFYSKLDEPPKELIVIGEIVQELNKKKIEEALDNSIITESKINGKNYTVSLGSIDDPNLISDFGEALTGVEYNGKLVDFSVIWYRKGPNELGFSLRGSKQSPDLVTIAQAFGGGGHEKASGFSVKLKEGEKTEDTLYKIFKPVDQKK